jgi:oligopeptide/dipeptide ABC transporter ATP-binding protein
MYAGRIVEENDVRPILAAPAHHYTRGLLAATVGAADRGRALATIEGAPPDLAALGAGCAFAERCPAASAQCRGRQPALTRDGAHAFACWHPIAPAER